ILLVQFIKSYREQGMSAQEAAGAASRARFRAILITTSTTVAGMLPLLAETSTQAMAVIPLVISVVFGLLVSTVLILVALPALYAILEDLGWARNNGSGRKRPGSMPRPFASAQAPTRSMPGLPYQYPLQGGASTSCSGSAAGTCPRRTWSKRLTTSSMP